MYLRTYTKRSVRVIVIPADVTISNSTELTIGLSETARETDFRHAVIDMSAVSFMGSAGFGALVEFYRALEKRRGRLALAGVQPSVMEVLTTMRIASLLLIAPTVPEAIARILSADREFHP